MLLLFSASMILLPITGFFVTKNIIIEGTQCRVGSRTVRPECVIAISLQMVRVFSA